MTFAIRWHGSDIIPEPSLGLDQYCRGYRVALRLAAGTPRNSGWHGNRGWSHGSSELTVEDIGALSVGINHYRSMSNFLPRPCLGPAPLHAVVATRTR